MWNLQVNACLQPENSEIIVWIRSVPNYPTFQITPPYLTSPTSCDVGRLQRITVPFEYPVVAYCQEHNMKEHRTSITGTRAQGEITKYGRWLQRMASWYFWHRYASCRCLCKQSLFICGKLFKWLVYQSIDPQSYSTVTYTPSYYGLLVLRICQAWPDGSGHTCWLHYNT